MIENVVEDLLGHYKPDTPVAVVKKASWNDQKVIRGTLEDISFKVKEAGIEKTAMIVVGKVLDPGDITPSKLYDAEFTHEYRKGTG
jgi:precorrin-4/cobalt-precorrin-4 C11-methyltransferase